MNNRDKGFIIFISIIILILLSSSTVSAENLTNASIENVSIDDSNIQLESNLSSHKSYEPNNMESSKFSRSNPEIKIFITSDNPGSNILDQASIDVMKKYPNVKIYLRTGNQVSKMSDAELESLLTNCDIFIGQWLTNNACNSLTNILNNRPELANKKAFLVLETSSTSSLKIMNLSTINYKKIFNGYSESQLADFYLNTKRGDSYETINNYLVNGSGKNFPELYKKGIRYKVLNDKANLYNEILWVMNISGYKIGYSQPEYTGVSTVGIFRERWYFSLDDYKKDFFKANSKGTIGIIESDMYVKGNSLNTFYSIVESFEKRGYNVIPVFAPGGTESQLDVMVDYFTDAENTDDFIKNPSKYKKYVNFIVSLPGYGLGGSKFTETTNFFEKLNVPVVRAIHSDFQTNEEWELGSTGINVLSGDKWWHVAISEAQGIIMPTFIGGKSVRISSYTGSEILDYIPVKKNIELLASQADSWIRLQNAKNSDKKISLMYYNYPPGKDNIGSSYLNTIPSLYNLLYTLKDEGYDVGNLPSNPDELQNILLKRGINIANWAPGELEKLVSDPNVILFPVAEYENWFSNLSTISKIQVVEGPVAYIGEWTKRAVEINYTDTVPSKINQWYNGVNSLLPDENRTKAIPILDNVKLSLNNYASTGDYKYFNEFLKYKKQFKDLNISGLSGWGEIPGDIMVVSKNGTKYFVIPGVKYGNVFLGPEPQRGWEANINALYHSTAVAPPHQYLAYFAYLQKYYPDALVSIGRHATHEWLPGKEMLLSTDDFPTICAGSVPQIYYYISDGVAEGIQAKRRAASVMISHLTPPMTFTKLYGGFAKLADLSDRYEDSSNSTEKSDISNEIRKIIIDNKLLDLFGLSSLNNISDDELNNLVINYIDSMQSQLYPSGLHTIGKKWTPDAKALLVSSMLSVNFYYDESHFTTLQDEISMLLYKKPFNNISAFNKDIVQDKCFNTVKLLIDHDISYVLVKLTLNPSKGLKFAMNLSKKYLEAIDLSFEMEISSFINGLNGGFIRPGPGGDPIADPNVIPTGTNFFHDQAKEIPTIEAYENSKILTKIMLADLDSNIEKLALGIWCVETARDDGALVCVFLNLLGMKPEWSDSPSAGTGGKKLKEMPVYVPLNDLIRPDGWDKKRIDVTTVTSGLFRDLYSRQAGLMDSALRITLSRSYLTIINNQTLIKKYGKDNLLKAINPIIDSIGRYGVSNEALSDNYLAKHWVEDFQYYINNGYTPEEAGEFAVTRIFAPPTGDYGAGISKLVSMSWTWENRSQLGEFYINRMGNMYSKNNWGTSNPYVFRRALTGIDSMVATRNTNLYGVMDNDDFFDYWGGLSMALEKVNGKAPNFSVLKYADMKKVSMSSIEQSVSQELSTRNLNPDWIKNMMNEGYGGARYMTKKFTSNLMGWKVTVPDSVKGTYFDKVYNVYVKDEYNIGVTEFLKSGKNSFAYADMLGTMLTAIYEGYWTPDEAVHKDIVEKWVKAIETNGVTCCDCTCGNIAMMTAQMDVMNVDLLERFKDVMYNATQNSAFKPSVKPPAEQESDNPANPSDSSEPSSDSSEPSPNSPTNIGSDSSSNEPNQDTGQNVLADASQVASQGSQGSSDISRDEEERNEVGEGGEPVAQAKGEAYELNPKESSKKNKTGMPIQAIIALFCIVLLVAYGYIRNNKKSDDE